MKKILLISLTVYQKVFSPLLHQLLGVNTGCRSTPSCSVYAHEVISRYGTIKGTLLSMRRLLSCQPFFSI